MAHPVVTRQELDPNEGEGGAEEADGVGQLVLLVDLQILGVDVLELVLEKLVKVTLNALPSFGDILVSKPLRRLPSCW